jgi:glycosyltransferase involved in cell wall biosynthesis
LNVVGWGPDKETLVAEYGKEPNIHFQDGVEGRAKWACIQNNDVLVLPSRLPESFGVVIVEAYAMGKPVIASKIGGIPEIVKNAETGLLVAPASVDELIAAIEQFLRSPGLYAELSVACKQLSYQFSLDAFRENYLAAYGCA